MDVESKMKGLRKLTKDLGEEKFTVRENGSDFSLCKGKKLVVLKTTLGDWANKVCDALNNTMKAEQDTAEMFVADLEKRCEQLTLDIFKEE